MLARIPVSLTLLVHTHLSLLALTTLTGDNFTRTSGDVKNVEKLQAFAWEAQKRGESAMHANANPTLAELALKQAASRSSTLSAAAMEERKSIIDKYGGAAHLQTLPAELSRPVEAYVEYAADGTVLKGASTATRSRWEEDVYLHYFYS